MWTALRFLLGARAGVEDVSVIGFCLKIHSSACAGECIFCFYVNRRRHQEVYDNKLQNSSHNSEFIVNLWYVRLGKCRKCVLSTAVVENIDIFMHNFLDLVLQIWYHDG